MTSVVLNMATGCMQLHETADEEQKHFRHFEGLDVASPVAAIVLNNGLQRLAKLVSLSSPCSPNATDRNRVKYFDHERRHLSGMSCVRPCG